MVVQAFKREEEMNGNLSLRSAKRRRDTVQVFECSFPARILLSSAIVLATMGII